MFGYLKLHLSICMLIFVQLNYLNKVINGVEIITELSVSGKKRDEQKQATLAKPREAYYPGSEAWV